ncbi:MAG: TraR/DksA family transcriptional regulator [Deltaproteobacteria bacterium]|nr:TraR/DksA family transcriptional regulator [Deltaproteobacteria bacterium]
MNAEEAARLRELLKARLDARLAQGPQSVAREDVDTSATAHDDDLGPHMQMDQAIASGRNAAWTAETIALAAALRRLDDEPDSFGDCEDCGEPIPFRRLELLPHATLCVRCQAAQETGPARRRKVTDYV